MTAAAAPPRRAVRQACSRGPGLGAAAAGLGASACCLRAWGSPCCICVLCSWRAAAPLRRPRRANPPCLAYLPALPSTSWVRCCYRNIITACRARSFANISECVRVQYACDSAGRASRHRAAAEPVLLALLFSNKLHPQLLLALFESGQLCQQGAAAHRSQLDSQRRCGVERPPTAVPLPPAQRKGQRSGFRCRVLRLEEDTLAHTAKK